MLTAARNSAADSSARLARASYRDIALYSAPRGTFAVDLSDNTNLWGAPPSASRALADFAPDDITRYPVAFEPALSAALADYAGVSPDMVVCGCGSDDVLDSAIRAFAEPGEMLCLPDPSFSMISVFARANGLSPIAIPFALSPQSGVSPPRFDVAADAMLDTGAKIIYLCSPNNPTGTELPRKTVERIVERAPGLVIIDQAYAEFGGESFTDLASSGHPVLVTRTMSKAFGLAGLRVGYGIGSPRLIAEVLKSIGPYKVNALAERVATAVLAEDRSWVRDRVAESVANRSRFRTELTKRGFTPLESSANFVLVPVRDSAAVSRVLEVAGVRVRTFASLTGIGDAIRIAIGPWEMMQCCLDALNGAAENRLETSGRRPR